MRMNLLSCGHQRARAAYMKAGRCYSRFAADPRRQSAHVYRAPAVLRDRASVVNPRRLRIPSKRSGSLRRARAADSAVLPELD